MQSLRRMATISVIGTYIVIFLGGLVRVAGAGLGCPDWPKCFGRWIPPTSLEQVPASFDPGTFNMTLAWIEYVNRLAGMTLGLIILTLAIMAIINRHNLPSRIWVSSIIAAILVAIQGWQGSLVVASEIEPVIVSVHMMSALVLVSLLIYIAQQLHYLNSPEADSETTYPPGIGKWMMIFWVLAIIQAVLGTQLREAIELMKEVIPMGLETAWMGRIGPINHIHMTLGIVVIATGLHIAVKFLIRSKNLSLMVYQSVLGLILLLVVQLFAGFGLFMLGTKPIIQLIHVWDASILIGLSLLLLGAVRHKAEK